MMTNEYGEELFELDDGRLVPYYIRNLINFGDTVIPKREDLNEKSIFRDYGLRVKIETSEMETFLNPQCARARTIRIARIVNKG